jgi:reactive intermediate/imine deaminase
MKRYIGVSSGSPLTPAVECGSSLFISGQVPTNAQGRVEGGIREQTKTVLSKIDGLLKDAGLTRSDVVKTTVFLKSATDFAEMNSIYQEFFDRQFPARSTVQAELMIDALVEIEAIAMKSS